MEWCASAHGNKTATERNHALKTRASTIVRTRGTKSKLATFETVSTPPKSRIEISPFITKLVVIDVPVKFELKEHVFQLLPLPSFSYRPMIGVRLAISRHGGARQSNERQEWCDDQVFDGWQSSALSRWTQQTTCCSHRCAHLASFHFTSFTFRSIFSSFFLYVSLLPSFTRLCFSRNVKVPYDFRVGRWSLQSGVDDERLRADVPFAEGIETGPVGTSKCSSYLRYRSVVLNHFR